MTAMRLSYLPANRAWAFTWGEQLIDMDGHYIFASEQKAIEAADRCGLHVKTSGSQFVVPKEEA